NQTNPNQLPKPITEIPLRVSSFLPRGLPPTNSTNPTNFSPMGLACPPCPNEQKTTKTPRPARHWEKVALFYQNLDEGFQPVSGQTLKHGFDQVQNGGTPVRGFGLKHNGRLQIRTTFSSSLFARPPPNPDFF